MSVRVGEWYAVFVDNNQGEVGIEMVVTQVLEMWHPGTPGIAPGSVYCLERDRHAKPGTKHLPGPRSIITSHPAYLRSFRHSKGTKFTGSLKRIIRLDQSKLMTRR
jgi:hypothetical protein